ncbi:thioredoxin [Microbacterium maritypicum]|uniref:Thioredoxin n=1 Tax=Microbacterium maritypicum TaxID=33918 RepID=A0A4Y4B4D1_MICMQ|nr:thioredoxin [Microbacterium liquefaciens]GEC74080.1 thiol reductase thioredoxin [Microbacterium liquefaciens]GGV48964.1 thiol reductase thioredoxin [Microbacterium liquefaciens]
MTTLTVTGDNLRDTISRTDIVILDFWAAWCGPCRAFAPVFEKASDTHSDITFGKVDTESERELAAGFQIRSIPTLMVFRGGIGVFSQPGALKDAQLEQVITSVRALDMAEVREQLRRRSESAHAPS